MKKKKELTINSAEYKNALRNVLHSTFVTKGTMVAFPLCFPETTLPLPIDESRITAIDISPDRNIVYCGTSGEKCHLLAGMFHGATGIVYDLGAIENTKDCVAVCCCKKNLISFVNDDNEGKIIKTELAELPFDLIQEWFFERKSLIDVGEIVKGEKILQAVNNADRSRIVGITENHLFNLNPDNNQIEIIAEIDITTKIVHGKNNIFWGFDLEDTLWRLDLNKGKLCRQEVKLPTNGVWNTGKGQLIHSFNGNNIFVSDAEGKLFSLNLKSSKIRFLGKTVLNPIQTMTETCDGRIFGFCGDEIMKLFCCNPKKKKVEDLGCAISVLQRRRYGYNFSCSVLGRDGQVIFGENDNAGHLWNYFPAII